MDAYNIVMYDPYQAALYASHVKNEPEEQTHWIGKESDFSNNNYNAVTIHHTLITDKLDIKTFGGQVSEIENESNRQDSYDQNCVSDYSQRCPLDMRSGDISNASEWQNAQCNNNVSVRDTLKSYLKMSLERKTACTTDLTTNEPFSCEICGKSFQKYNNLQMHLKSHKVTYRCDVCLEVFSQKRHFVRHKSVHLEDKNCRLCSKTFASKMLLRFHMRIHTTENPSICEVCSKPFKNELALKRHDIVHRRNNIEKKCYECNICGKKYNEKRLYKKHCILHDLKPFGCLICLTLFKTHHELETHHRDHTVYKHLVCEVCLKPFKEEKALKRHKKIHAERKYFDCNICGKKFVDNSNMMFHCMNHNILKQFSCLVCHRSFELHCELLHHQQTYNCAAICA